MRKQSLTTKPVKALYGGNMKKYIISEKTIEHLDCPPDEDKPKDCFKVDCKECWLRALGAKEVKDE
jgi:hypothetical protein